MNLLTDLIEVWAKDKGLDKAQPEIQLNKLTEEVGELARGVNKKNKDLAVDSIGDVYVVLTILAMQLGFDIEYCVEQAYNEIKDRQGETINGMFIKQEDLHD